MSGGFEAIGITYLGGDHTPTCPATSCSAFWLTGCKPTCWVIWTARANVCSTVRPEDAGQRAVDLARRTADLRPGTVLGREWNGQMQRVAVLADGFAWNGKTYPSLSRVAFAITGTRWSGPKFFGLRDKPPKRSSP
jgi:hypothetical protein